MATRDLLGRLGERLPGASPFGENDAPGEAPLGGTRAQALQRLQIGLAGLTVVIAFIAIAGVIGNLADRAEEAAVPDAAPTTEPSPAPAQRDPLADAGVVPDISAETEAAARMVQERSGPVAQHPEVSTLNPGPVALPDTPDPRKADGPKDPRAQRRERQPPPDVR